MGVAGVMVVAEVVTVVGVVVVVKAVVVEVVAMFEDNNVAFCRKASCKTPARCLHCHSVNMVKKAEVVVLRADISWI